MHSYVCIYVYVIQIPGSHTSLMDIDIDFAKNIWNCYIFARVCFLICDILEHVYHSACDKKFSVQLDPYLVQRKWRSLLIFPLVFK